MVMNVIKGVFIGLALIIPGLSASTFAVVLGLYDKLIFSLNNIRKDFKTSAKFLAPLGIGAAVGILASAGFLLFVVETFPIPSYAFFIGLVIGSIPVIYKKMKPGLPQKFNFSFLVLGLAAILLVGFFTPDTGDGTYILYMSSFSDVAIIAAAGFIACFLIALPGVSGAMILILIGQFDTVYGAVSNFANSLLMMVRGQEGAWDLGSGAFLIVLVFFVGAVTGLVLAAKIIGALIQRFEASVYFAVMGLVLGAVWVLFDIELSYILTHTFAGGGLIIARDMGLVAASLALGYICTGFFGRSKPS
ncbi:MAG: DUF368 domain-containing protein [Defluviitaleaceae bacterium]|nr:DUF368 domain-containing protein [Defluviitaleaceae bacterium]